MESFAKNVRSGARFDPTMEEGGRTKGMVQKQDEEMVEAVIETPAEANKPTAKGGFNLFQAQKGEILLENLERNVSGFLVRKEAIPFTFSKVECAHLILIVIAKFVGPKPKHRDQG